jgi:hypothetical protein
MRSILYILPAPTTAASLLELAFTFPNRGKIKILDFGI